MSDYKAKYTGPPLIAAYFCLERVIEGDEEVDKIIPFLPVNIEAITKCYLVVHLEAKGHTGVHRFCVLRQDAKDSHPVTIIDWDVEFPEEKEEMTITTIVDVPTHEAKRMLYWLAVDEQLLDRVKMDVVHIGDRPKDGQVPEKFHA